MTPRAVALPVAGSLALLAIWEGVARGPFAGSPLAPPSQAVAALAALLADGEFWAAALWTAWIAVAGFTLALVVGVALGVLLASWPAAYHLLRAGIEFLKPVPPIVVLPLVVLVLGPSADMGIFLVFFGCVLPVLTQTIAGVMDTDPVAADTARSYRLPFVTRLARVVLPGTLPFVATGVRIASAAALIVAVVAGLVGGGPGLGKELFFAVSAADYPRVYAYVIVLGAAGVLVNVLVSRVERAVLHWHPSVRGALA